MANTRVRFTVVSALLNGHQVELDPGEPISVGRTWDNRLALDHKSVSRRHARIEFDGATFRLVDLKSHNGTQVNDSAITERTLQPNDTVGFGEILVRFEPIGFTPPPGEGAASPAEGMTLPAVVPAADQAHALARPLGLDDIFVQAGATEAIPKSEPRKARMNSSVLYALLLTTVIVAGGFGIWHVGRVPEQPLTIAVQLRVGDFLPVDVGRRIDPSRQKFLPGLSKIDRIGDADTSERVAHATRTEFRTFVLVRGRSEGEVDIPIYGPPLGKIILRVLVRGAKPPPPRLPPSNVERKKRARDIYNRVHERTRSAHADQTTTASLKELRYAKRLLGGEIDNTLFTLVSKEEKTLRELRERRYEELVRLIDVESAKGNYGLAVKAADRLLRIYTDPEEPTYHVVRLHHQKLVERRDYEERQNK